MQSSIWSRSIVCTVRPSVLASEQSRRSSDWIKLDLINLASGARAARSCRLHRSAGSVPDIQWWRSGAWSRWRTWAAPAWSPEPGAARSGTAPQRSASAAPGHTHAGRQVSAARLIWSARPWALPACPSARTNPVCLLKRRRFASVPGEDVHLGFLSAPRCVRPPPDTADLIASSLSLCSHRSEWIRPCTSN